MSSRFVRPDTTTLKISDGDTLTVKRRLNTGEQRTVFGTMSRELADGTLRANPLEVGIALVTAYLVDWSLTDADGVRVEIRGVPPEQLRAVLDELEPDVFEEIRVAINAHVDAQAVIRAAEKNGKDGGSGSPAISPLLDGAAGAMSGSPT